MLQRSFMRIGRLERMPRGVGRGCCGGALAASNPTTASKGNEPRSSNLPRSVEVLASAQALMEDGNKGDFRS